MQDVVRMVTQGSFQKPGKTLNFKAQKTKRPQRTPNIPHLTWNNDTTRNEIGLNIHTGKPD